MMKDIVVQFPRVRKFLQSADDILRIRLSTLMIDGSEEELTLTANAQPALLMHSMALLQLLKATSIFLVIACPLGYSLSRA
jgi:[acyl-carrier-protein] S-malonyltransferase